VERKTRKRRRSQEPEKNQAAKGGDGEAPGQGKKIQEGKGVICEPPLSWGEKHTEKGKG